MSSNDPSDERLNEALAGEAALPTGPEGEPIHPFQATSAQLSSDLPKYTAAVLANLSSHYLEVPRGNAFVTYDRFEAAYGALEHATKGFTILDRRAVLQAVQSNSLVLVVVRTIVGLSPPELADLATGMGYAKVDQQVARYFDQKARSGLNTLAKARPDTVAKIYGLIEAACAAIEQGAPSSTPLVISRMDKVDTAEGLRSVQRAAQVGIKYPELLYERMLGRPFATLRDSVSGKVGDIIEDVVKSILNEAKIPFYKTKRIDQIPGFDQAPDFLIPTKEAPKIVIEAKLCQDDGTARDKITRVQHLRTLSDQREQESPGTGFEVIACIDGRGFRQRRNDMGKLIIATAGKVFTLATMEGLVEYSGLKAFAKSE